MADLTHSKKAQQPPGGDLYSPSRVLPKSRIDLFQQELEVCIRQLRDLWPDLGSPASPFPAESEALRGLKRLESRFRAGYTSDRFDPALFHFPGLIGKDDTEVALTLLVAKRLAELTPDGSIRLSIVGRAAEAVIEQRSFLQKLLKRYEHLQGNPATLTHETSSDSWILISELLLQRPAGQALAELILSQGGRVAILQHQARPAAGSIGAEISNSIRLARPFAADLVATHGSARVCRLNIGGDPVGDEGAGLDASDFWVRDLVGFFGLENHGTRFERPHYFSMQRDLLSGSGGYFHNYSEASDNHLSIRRTQLGIEAAGGFLYPLGQDSFAVSSAIFDRHNRDSNYAFHALRGLPLTRELLEAECALLGRPHLEVIPPLFENPRHIDTAIAQVGTVLLVGDPTIPENVDTIGAEQREKLTQAYLRTREALEAFCNTDVVPLPIPMVRHSSTGSDTNPLLTINMVQFLDARGQRHLIVPWISDTHDDYVRRKEFYERQKERIREVLTRGIDSDAAALNAITPANDRIHFHPFMITNGGLRCATQHVPETAIQVLRKSHEVL